MNTHVDLTNKINNNLCTIHIYAKDKEKVRGQKENSKGHSLQRGNFMLQ